MTDIKFAIYPYTPIKILKMSSLEKLADIRNNDDKRIQTFGGTETYPYGTNAFKVCQRFIL